MGGYRAEAASTQKGCHLTQYLGDYLALLSGVKITPESIPQVVSPDYGVI